MAKYYAHTRINYGAEVEPNTGVILKVHTLECGDEVTAKKLGVSKEEWEKLIADGVVRTREYPPTKATESPRDYHVRKAQQALDAAEEGLDEAMYGTDDDDEDDDATTETTEVDPLAELGGGDESASG